MKNNKFDLTLTMLAKMCGVSEGTVDRALHNRKGIKKETKDKILNAARRHGYIDDEKKNTSLIGVVVFDVYNTYFSEFLMAFEAECKEAGYSLVVMFTKKEPDIEYTCINQLYYMGVEGIVLCPCNKNGEVEKFLASIDINVITIGNRLNGIAYVGTDNFMAMYDACDVLKSKSNKILYYSPALKNLNNKSAQQERYDGFISYVSKNNIEYQVIKDFNDLTEILDNDNSWAVLCSTDYYKIQVAAKYPDCIVMGIDGLTALKKSDYCQINVDTNIENIAKDCVDASICNKKEDVIVPYTIISDI